MEPIIFQSITHGDTELLVGSLSIILALIVAFLIYRDANTRKSHHALAWGVGSFFGGPIVWILYFVVRDEVGSSESD